jgi:hypothetical protein
MVYINTVYKMSVLQLLDHEDWGSKLPRNLRNIYHSLWRHIAEDLNSHHHRRENLKFRVLLSILLLNSTVNHSATQSHVLPSSWRLRMRSSTRTVCVFISSTTYTFHVCGKRRACPAFPFNYPGNRIQLNKLINHTVQPTSHSMIVTRQFTFYATFAKFATCSNKQCITFCDPASISTVTATSFLRFVLFITSSVSRNSSVGIAFR